jgi:hypothetical protein
MDRASFTPTVTVDEYTVNLSGGQIMIYVGKELIKAIDIKDLNDEQYEFNQYIEKFKKSVEVRNAKRLVK